jgi:hypothetical protein
LQNKWGADSAHNPAPAKIWPDKNGLLTSLLHAAATSCDQSWPLAGGDDDDEDTMLSMIIWVVALAAGIAGIAVTAAMEARAAHMLATAFASIAIVAAAVHEHRAATLANASPYRLAALAARHMGMLWAWSGIATFVVYGFVLEWSHWVTGVFTMFTCAVMYLFIALILDREATASIPDPRTATLLSFLTKCTFGLSAALLGILFAVQRHPELSAESGEYWAALNLAMGTIAGLLSLTGYLLLSGAQTGVRSAKTAA